MSWDSIAGAVCGVLNTLLLIMIVVTAIKRSPVGWLMIVYEYFFFLGVCIYPILLYFDVIEVPELFAMYVLSNGSPSVATFTHLLLYGIGSWCGYYLISNRLVNKCADNIIAFAVNNPINNYLAFYSVVGFSLLISAFFFNAVGFSTAISAASDARSGDFSGFLGFEQYMFLKVLASVGMFAIVFIPYIIMDQRHTKLAFMGIFLIGISIYIETVARAAIQDSIGVLFLLYCVLNKKKGVSFFIFSGLVLALASFVFIYGKSFVVSLSLYLFENKEFELIDQGSESNEIGYFFEHFAHLVYSADAGLKHFATHGSIIPNDILLSPIGFLPSAVFSAFGLDFLSYQLITDKEQIFSCINSTYFPSANVCTTPPYYVGASAYLLPFAGAFLFGYVRFWIYAVIETCWMQLKDHAEFIWFPYFILLIAQTFMLFVPSTNAFAVFLLIMLWTLLKIRKIFVSN